MLSELSSIFSAYKNVEECGNVVEKFSTLAKHLIGESFNPFGAATLQAIAQITIKLLHHLKGNDIERVLLLLLKNGLLSREILICLLSNFKSFLAPLLYNNISDVRKLTPHQQALLLKYVVLSHKCDRPELDEDLFRSISLLFICGCTVGPYVTLRSLFLSGMCNHKTSYGNCLGTRLIDECVASETSRGVHSRNIISKLTENYFINAHDKKQGRSMFESVYTLLNDVDLDGIWRDITILPPVSLYMDTRSQNNFHRHLHLRFMQNEISLYILSCSISHCKDVSNIVSEVFSNLFTLFPSDPIKSAVTLLINNSTDSLLETDLSTAQSLEKLFPSLPDTLPGEPEIKKAAVAKSDPSNEAAPVENKESSVAADTTARADCAGHLIEPQINENYSNLIESAADSNFKQFISSYHYNYLFMAGSLRGLDASFLEEATAFIYSS